MSSRLHNLLRPEKQKDVALLYYLRVVGVAGFLLGSVMLVGIIALVPAYLSLTGKLSEVDKKALEYADEASSRESVESAVAEARVEFERIVPYVSQVKITDHIEQVFKKRPDAIAITGFSYDRVKNSMRVEGQADTRPDLVAFVALLEEEVYFSHVQLPIADLAQNIDLIFTITLTLPEVIKEVAYE